MNWQTNGTRLANCGVELCLIWHEENGFAACSRALRVTIPSKHNCAKKERLIARVLDSIRHTTRHSHRMCMCTTVAANEMLSVRHSSGGGGNDDDDDDDGKIFNAIKETKERFSFRHRTLAIASVIILLWLLLLLVWLRQTHNKNKNKTQNKKRNGKKSTRRRN